MNDLPPGQPPKDAAPGAGQPSGPRALKPRFRRRMRRRPRYKGPSFNRLVPNIMTLLGLCAGLTSIRYAIDGRFGAAAVAIAVAGLIDGLDGRLARLLKAVTRFGAEFDSLSDFLCFGVAPSFVMYLWSLHTADGFGFMPCLMFSVCMALRLARFNAALDSGPLVAFLVARGARLDTRDTLWHGTPLGWAIHADNDVARAALERAAMELNE